MRQRVLAIALAAMFIGALVFGADKKVSLGKLVVAYEGGACEAATWVAYHNGFFAAEGLDVELRQVEFETLRTSVATGKVDATTGNFGWFKAIEQGFAVSLTGGIHAGCIKLVAPKDSGITRLQDLKGKTIGIDGIGAGPQIDLSIALRSVGIDPKTEVQWRAYPPPQLSTAVSKKEIDAFVVWDPFASQAVADEGYVTILDIAKDEPFKSGYCCYSVVSDSLIKKYPKKAAAFTRAVLKAAKWVGEHPRETAELEVSKGYVPGDVKLIESLIASYYWRPSIQRAKENAKFFIAEQKKDGILEASTDEAKLLKRLFVEVIKDDEI